MYRLVAGLVAGLVLFSCSMNAQSLGNAGTVEGTVVDPSGAAVPRAEVEIRNPITGYSQKTKADETGAFRFVNVPPNPYHVQATATGFAPAQQDLTVRTAIPVSLRLTLSLQG